MCKWLTNYLKGKDMKEKIPQDPNPLDIVNEWNINPPVEVASQVEEAEPIHEINIKGTNMAAIDILNTIMDEVKGNLLAEAYKKAEEDGRELVDVDDILIILKKNGYIE